MHPQSALSARSTRFAGRLRVAATVVAAVALTAALAACQPEPSPTASPTGSSNSPSSSGSASAAVPTPTPIETNLPDAGFELPTDCESIYSAAMLAALNEQNPPLNDPGVTMTSTQNVTALETLGSGIPTIRCSWGRPSEFGLATNVSIIDEAQSEALLAALAASGFACADLSGGTLCTTEQTVIDQDDNQVTIGESHYLRGDGWVSTAMINFTPDGYTQDIVGVLWG